VARLALSAPVVAYGAASAAVVINTGDDPTSYAAASTGAAAADLVAGLALIAAGSFAWAERIRGSLGPVTILLGAAWLALDWVGWVDGPAVVRSVATIAAPLLLPLLVHLVLALPDGRIAAPASRIAVAAAYAVAAVVAVGRALVRDPLRDLDCWSNCTDNVFLVHADQGLANALDFIWLRLSAVIGLVLAAVALRRLLRATPAGRAALWAVLAPAALAAAAEAAYALALIRDPVEDPERAVFATVFTVRALAYAGLAAGVVWTAARDRRARTAVSRLAADLGEAPAPGSLQAVLARSLGDHGLEVAYWLPGSRRYVDGAGRPAAPRAGAGRATTPIVRNGEPVALVIHDRGLSGAERLEREIGAAARLAVDNERLRAEGLAQLEDLRASRARIVEAGDSARRRIERDLHDGAQQRLLALSYELRLAQAAAGDDYRLATACNEAQAALEELRELAVGIHPAILTEAGLGPALWTLAEDAPLPVEIGAVPDERFTEAVERAAYLLVAGAIEACAYAGADLVEAALRRGADALEIRVDWLGQDTPTHLADRVGALGGRLALADGVLHAEIPCA
jgi:signal transduction histidine kinase